MQLIIQQFQVADGFDPGQNVEAGAKYLKQLLDIYQGELPLALGRTRPDRRRSMPRAVYPISRRPATPWPPS
jgi:soluble lytic murein transglycosylase-like protein